MSCVQQIQQQNRKKCGNSVERDGNWREDWREHKAVHRYRTSRLLLDTVNWSYSPHGNSQSVCVIAVNRIFLVMLSRWHNKSGVSRYVCIEHEKNESWSSIELCVNFHWMDIRRKLSSHPKTKTFSKFFRKWAPHYPDEFFYNNNMFTWWVSEHFLWQFFVFDWFLLFCLFFCLFSMKSW